MTYLTKMLKMDLSVLQRLITWQNRPHCWSNGGGYNRRENPLSPSANSGVCVCIARSLSLTHPLWKDLISHLPPLGTAERGRKGKRRGKAEKKPRCYYGD